MDPPELAAFLTEHHGRDLLRVKTLDRYSSASDGAEFDRFRAGEPEPDRAAKAAWLDRIRADVAAGRTWRRRRIVQPPLTDYVRYSCQSSTAVLGIRDFYLLDNSHAAAMTYDQNGRFTSAEPVTAPVIDGYRAAAQVGWQLAEPFDRWWSRHPEHHRRATR